MKLDPRLCRYLGHLWPDRYTFYPVRPPMPTPTYKPEPISVDMFKVEARAELHCQRRCGVVRVIDYDGKVVSEGT